MYIVTDIYFVPKHFLVYTFYGEVTCFCWNEDKLVIFPYPNNQPSPFEVLTAPAPIKTIQCFSGRIFLICIPRGIYKLSRHRQFAVLSKSAIGMGSIFYEVLTPRNKYLYLNNKQKMTSKALFQLSTVECDSNKLCVCPLNVQNVEECFMRALSNGNTTVENLCIISNGVKLLTLMNETVQIIYSSIHSIRDIILIPKNSRVAGLLLLTSSHNIVLMYSKDDVLIFENIFLGTYIQAICTGFTQLSENALWIIYSDAFKLYYAKKELLTDNVQRTTVQDNNIVCLQVYNSEVSLGLTGNKYLIEFFTDNVERALSLGNDTFINLYPNMLEGATCIMDKICKRTEELHALNEELTMEEDKLKKINLYAHRHKIKLCPKIILNRTANRFFLSVNLYDMLPKNCWVTLNAGGLCRRVFCSKKVSDQETTLDICVPESFTDKVSQVTIDLITLKDERNPWCLIKDYTISHSFDKSRGKEPSSNCSNFVNSKIAALQGFIKEGNISMKKLLEIKKSVRSRFSDA